LFAY
jgi:ABC-type transporter Mla subunit MlaD